MKIIIFIWLPFLAINLQAEIAGTPERLEREYKTAFLIDDSFKMKRAIDVLKEGLDLFQKSQSFHFTSLIHAQYYLDKRFKTFFFKDHYLDTYDTILSKSNSSYRLRYRWNRHDQYARYQLFPYIRSFFPSRCEIQFKRDYSIDPTSQQMRVYESRFEFRNESSPFIFEGNAPPPPWPLKQYLRYAQSGRFHSYQILPSTILSNKMPNVKPDLVETVNVHTTRFRNHINITYNPWGSGPNINQVFIVSLDVSSWIYANGKKSTNSLLELEIELDRNTSTMIENGLEIMPISWMTRMTRDASFAAHTALKKDHHHLQNLLSDLLKKEVQSNPLPTDFKYHRILELMNL